MKLNKKDLIDLGLKIGALAVTLVGGIISGIQSERYLDKKVNEKLDPVVENIKAIDKKLEEKIE